MGFNMVMHLLVSGLTLTGRYIIRVSKRTSPKKRYIIWLRKRTSPNGAIYLKGGCSPPVLKERMIKPWRGAIFTPN